MQPPEYSTVERANRCNELCTKFLTGSCALCDALAERDRFEWPFWWLVRILSAWCLDAWVYLTGPTGYRVVVPVLATLIGVYAGLYAIAEARHDRLLNRATFERNTFITIVLFVSLDDAKLFADALLALKHAPGDVQNTPDVQKANVPDQGYIGKSAGEIILTWGHPSFVYGDYRDPIYVYIVQDKAMVFIFKARSCVYTDVMALEEVEAFLGMHREREKKSFNNPQLVY